MMIPPHVMANVATNGSPEMLTSVGRLFGFGDAEQKALLRGEFPRWSIFVLGAAVGAVAGILVQRRFPEQVTKVLGR